MNDHIVAVGPLLPERLAHYIHDAIRSGNCYPLILELAQLAEVQVSGLVVYGSMAARHNLEKAGTSDVDLLLLTDVPASGGIYGFSQDLQVDLHVQSRELTMNNPSSNWIYANGRVLWDLRKPELEEWLKSLVVWKHANLERWTKVDRLRNSVWAYRLVKRIEHLTKIDMAQARLHESRLISAIPSIHAHLCEMHTTSMSNWWRDLPKMDPSFLEILEAYLSGGSTTVDSKSLHKVVDYLFSSNERSLFK